MDTVVTAAAPSARRVLRTPRRSRCVDAPSARRWRTAVSAFRRRTGRCTRRAASNPFHVLSETTSSFVYDVLYTVHCILCATWVMCIRSVMSGSSQCGWVPAWTMYCTSSFPLPPHPLPPQHPVYNCTDTFIFK
jgi:hypothetical protein